MPNTLKANEMRLHLGKKVDYEQKDLIVEFENNESHLLVVSQDLNARIALMKLLFQNIKSANKELVFCNKEKRLIRSFDAQKEYGITPVENILSVLDTAMNPNQRADDRQSQRSERIARQSRGRKVKIVFRKSHRQRAVLRHFCA